MTDDELRELALKVARHGVDAGQVTLDQIEADVFRKCGREVELIWGELAKGSFDVDAIRTAFGEERFRRVFVACCLYVHARRGHREQIQQRDRLEAGGPADPGP